MESAAEAYAQLNAIVARLYGLSRADYIEVVGSFPLLSPEVRRQCLSAARGDAR